MAAPRKYDDRLRQAIHEFVNEQDRPATQIRPLLEAQGFTQLPPVETIRAIARATKGDLTDKPKAQQLAVLLAGLVKATDAEISRVQAEPGDDTADQLLKLARTIREIEPLLADKKPEKDKQPSGLLGNLGQDSNAATPKPSGGTSAAVRSLAA